MVLLRERFLGTLIGTAVGDALGHPFEGWSRTHIETEVGRVKDFLPGMGWGGFPPGQYTDDTQLTIAIAESLIRSGGFNLSDLIDRFIDWLNEPPIGPGYGCLSSIQKLQLGYSWREAASDSGGNGTAMRVSPIGLFYHDSIPNLIEYARLSSVITHGHWAATASAIVVARSVAYLVLCDKLDVPDFLQAIAAAVDHPEFEDYAQNILQLPEYLEMDSVDALIELGGIGIKPPWPNPAETRQGYISAYAMSTTLSALYCFLSSPNDFENSVVEAVMAGGDTDTTGAITGAISGAFNGLDEIPPRWSKNVVNSHRIQEIALDLHRIWQK